MRKQTQWKTHTPKKRQKEKTFFFKTRETIKNKQTNETKQSRVK